MKICNESPRGRYENWNENQPESLMKYSMKTPSINYERGNESGQDS